METARDPASAELVFDPAAVLERDARVLLNPQFLGSLHAELREQLGERGAARALLQMGCLHGLRDAFAALRTGPCAGHGEAGPAWMPPLRLRCRVQGAAEPHGPLEVRGSWPEGGEAAAHLAAFGDEHGAACFASAGYTSGWLSGAFGSDLLAVETRCSTSGEAGCDFVAREVEVWRGMGLVEVDELLDALPFESLRRLVHEQATPERDPAPGAADALPGENVARLERDPAVVHIWGPLMVVPYTGSDEALRALELMGRDPSASEVSVVVLDLSGAVPDEAFGALALEQMVRIIETWGAELILAEVSTLAQPIVEGLEPPPLLVLKDLDHAIATAFQIAESQRRLL